MTPEPEFAQTAIVNSARTPPKHPYTANAAIRTTLSGSRKFATVGLKLNCCDAAILRRT